MFTIKLLPITIFDIDEATEDYNKKRESLGDELFIEIAEAIDLLKDNPFIFQKRYGEVRQVFIPRFSFSVYFLVEEQNKRVIVLAILHATKSPKIWKRRADNLNK